MNRIPSQRSLAGALLLVGASALAACGGSADPTPSATGTPASTVEETTPPSAPSATETAGEETSVFDLEMGDCFAATEGDAVESVTVVSCDEAHLYEVFAVFDHEANQEAPYPGDETLLQESDADCQPYFEDYVGIDYQASAYWITSVTPSAETWAEGDREIVCALRLGEEAEETTGSAEGSGE